MSSAGFNLVHGAKVQLRDELAREGRVLGKYLLGSEPSGAALERYAAACAQSLGTEAPEADRSMLCFISLHPWSLPFLDAAAAILSPRALLRKKLLLMLAILETLPAHVAHFTPTPRSRGVVVVRLGWFATIGALTLLIGILLYGPSRRAR